MSRFRDNGERLSHFSDYRIVKCPNCQKPVDFSNLRITCIHCAYDKEFAPANCWYQMAPIHIQIDDFLEIPCCGEMLWAMNLEHLNFLEKYIASDLRERMPNVNRSIISRLPQWMKHRKNKNEILKCIQKLRVRLKEQGYQGNDHLTSRHSDNY